MFTAIEREEMQKRMRSDNEQIAKHMIAQCLDYHEFDNGQFLLAEPDGIWLCNADESKIEKVSNDTWMIQGINF